MKKSLNLQTLENRQLLDGAINNDAQPALGNVIHLDKQIFQSICEDLGSPWQNCDYSIAQDFGVEYDLDSMSHFLNILDVNIRAPFNELVWGQDPDPEQFCERITGQLEDTFAGFLSSFIGTNEVSRTVLSCQMGIVLGLNNTAVSWDIDSDGLPNSHVIDGLLTRGLASNKIYH